MARDLAQWFKHLSAKREVLSLVPGNQHAPHQEKSYGEIHKRCPLSVRL